jgi:hypothetical protein
MSEAVKRGPGRPARTPIIERTEETMTELRETNKDELGMAPVTRGLREAALRADELRARMNDDSMDPSMYDEFYIDPRKIPEGWDYNWKRESIAGMTDEQNMLEMRSGGWEPVDTRRHPDMMPIGHNGAIRKKGMILMERPKEITNIAQGRELATARELVNQKEKALGIAPAGTFERDRKQTGVRKSYEPMQVPRT